MTCCAFTVPRETPRGCHKFRSIPGQIIEAGTGDQQARRSSSCHRKPPHLGGGTEEGLTSGHFRQSPTNWPKDGEPTCRRGSVHPLAGDGWPSICAAYLGTLRFPGWTGSPCPLLGLAPGGVYQAATVARDAGALLPHRFTLACAVAGHRRSVLCGTFLRVAPTRFASTLPFGAPTFLDVIDAAATQSTHRPASVLQVSKHLGRRKPSLSINLEQH